MSLYPQPLQALYARKAKASKIGSVLFLTYHFPPQVGGIQTRIYHYLKTLSGRGVKTTVFVVGPGAPSATGLDPRLVHLVRCRGEMRHLPRSSLLLSRGIQTAGADALHVLTGSSTLLGLVAVIEGRIYRVRTAISLFGREDAKLLSWRQRVIFLLSATLAHSISTNSEATKRLIPIGFRKKTQVLLGGSEPSTSVGESGKEEGRILFVGRMVKRKGVDDLLRAFVVVHGEVGGAKLILVGDGPERSELTRMAADLGLSDAVEFKGHLEGAALHMEYERSTVCVLPSKTVPDDPANEGLGLSLIEASMHAKPLIGTNHGGIPEIIQNGVNGIVVPESDPRSLAKAILDVVREEEMAMEMGENALELARAKFTWEAATDRLLLSYV